MLVGSLQQSMSPASRLEGSVSGTPWHRKGCPCNLRQSLQCTGCAHLQTSPQRSQQAMSQQSTCLSRPAQKCRHLNESPQTSTCQYIPAAQTRSICNMQNCAKATAGCMHRPCHKCYQPTGVPMPPRVSNEKLLPKRLTGRCSHRSKLKCCFFPALSPPRMRAPSARPLVNAPTCNACAMRSVLIDAWQVTEHSTH